MIKAFSPAEREREQNLCSVTRLESPPRTFRFRESETDSCTSIRLILMQSADLVNVEKATQTENGPERTCECTEKPVTCAYVSTNRIYPVSLNAFTFTGCSDVI